MNWNWFPINAAEAIQSRMHRRMRLDSIKIQAEQRLSEIGVVDDLTGLQARILQSIVDED